MASSVRNVSTSLILLSFSSKFGRIRRELEVKEVEEVQQVYNNGVVELKAAVYFSRKATFLLGKEKNIIKI